MKDIQTVSHNKVTPSALESESGNEKPPLFASWRGWYLLVIGFLVFLILLFLFITNRYS